MKRIDLFSIASAIGLISTAAFAQFFPNFDVGLWRLPVERFLPTVVLSATVSLSDPAEQLYVIGYLKTLSGKAAR